MPGREAGGGELLSERRTTDSVVSRCPQYPASDVEVNSPDPPSIALWGSYDIHNTHQVSDYCTLLLYEEFVYSLALYGPLADPATSSDLGIVNASSKAVRIYCRQVMLTKCRRMTARSPSHGFARSEFPWRSRMQLGAISYTTKTRH